MLYCQVLFDMYVRYYLTLKLRLFAGRLRGAWVCIRVLY